MNCQKGDLAYILKPASLYGKIVNCVDLTLNSFNEPTWIVDEPFIYHGFKIERVEDEYLRPIRPSNEQDEMLRIAGLPRYKELMVIR